MLRRLSLLIVVLLLPLQLAFAQRTITGTVTDSESGEPLLEPTSS